MSDTTAREAGEELVGTIGDEIWVNLGPHLVDGAPVHSAIEDTARHVIRIVRAHGAARDPGEDALVEWLAEKAACELGDSRGLITDYEPKTIARWAARAVREHDAALPGEDVVERAYARYKGDTRAIGEHGPQDFAAFRTAIEAVRAHDARRPAGDAVERIAEAMWEDKEQDNQREWDTHAVFEAVSTPWMEAPDRERVWWRQKARAAIAALPGDTLEGLLAQVRALPFRERRRVLDALDRELTDNGHMLYPDGVLFLTPERIRAALKASGEGQGDADAR